MTRSIFYTDKSTRTFADNLVAFGFAQLLRELMAQQGDEPNDVVIKDCGTHFQLTTSHPIDPDSWAPAWTRICPAKAIRTVKNAVTLPANIPYADYEADREQVSLHYAAREKKVPHDELPPLPPHWDVSRAIVQLLALSGYNRLVIAWWNLGDYQPLAIDLLLDLFSSTPNDLVTSADVWKRLDSEYGWGISAETTCLQLYNPDQGKGQNKPKADGLSIDNVKGFWLIEWLKAVGIYDAAITRLVRGGKDRKTFVVSPRELSHSVSRAVMTDFANAMSSETSTKFDVLAAIRYADALLSYVNLDASFLARLLELRDVKKRVVAGFDTGFYKDLGNAVATMNISFVALPGWVRVESRDDITLYTDRTDNRGLLPQLELLTRQFDESHSDAFALLQHLRDFVSGDDLAAFLRFTKSYAGYYIRQRERGVNAVPLSYTLVEKVVQSMDKTYADIGDRDKHPGFHNIARAISESTVWAQWRKTKQNNTTYQIRYGLNQDLTRNCHEPEQFLETLGEFIHTYNAETSRAQELGRKPWRPMIEPSDVTDILNLIDEYGGNSRMIAQLLVAYGYTFIKDEAALQEENE